MPSRRDEWHRGRAENELRYCVVCRKYLAPAAWADHEHNPAVRAPDAGMLNFLDDLTSDVLYLGGVKVANCASVLVIEGVEVFRLRNRDRADQIRIDLDLRGPNGQLAVISDNQPKLMAPGYRFEQEGPTCAVLHAETGDRVVTVESVSSKALRLLGVFWVNGFTVTCSEHALTLGSVTLDKQQFAGKGTAILLRKSQATIGFAKR